MSTKAAKPRSPHIPVPPLRLAGIPLASWLDALPDLALTALFLGALLMPAHYGAAGIRWLGFLLAAEILAFHAAPFIGSIMLARQPRWLRFLGLLGLMGFYLLFALVASTILSSWQPLTAMLLLLGNRLLSLLLRDPRTLSPLEQWQVREQFIISMGFYLIAVLLGVLLALLLRAIGWEHPAYQVPGWPSLLAPVALCAGMLYFSAQSVNELFFSRPVGTPGYARPASSGWVCWGIHSGLWYIVWREMMSTAGLLLIAGFFIRLSLFSDSTGAVLVVSLAISAFVIFRLYMQAAHHHWLRKATGIMQGAPVKMILTVETDAKASRNATRVSLCRPDKQEGGAITLNIEPVRRWNILPHGLREIPADVYTTGHTHLPTVIRVGATCLCTSYMLSTANVEQDDGFR